ncbi:MAG: hypothetical protein PVG39_04685 [Desulfobacteraceae bacterium]|jgi:hypothetical protein
MSYVHLIYIDDNGQLAMHSSSEEEITDKVNEMMAAKPNFISSGNFYVVKGKVLTPLFAMRAVGLE